MTHYNTKIICDNTHSQTRQTKSVLVIVTTMPYIYKHKQVDNQYFCSSH